MTIVKKSLMSGVERLLEFGCLIYILAKGDLAGSENLGGENLWKLVDVMPKVDLHEQQIQKLAKSDLVGDKVDTYQDRDEVE
ncbi:hypothetical protein WN943_012912 [Citrus x changshan-huyou]